MADYPFTKEISAFATVTNASKTATLAAAPGAGKVIRITSFTMSCSLAATGNGGLMRIKESVTGNVIFSTSANNANEWSAGYYDTDRGLPLSANNGVVAEVTGAGTNDATANIAITGFIVG